LKRRSKEKPGSVLALLVEHARQQLDQTSKVTLSPASKENLTLGVKLSSYFAIVLRPQLGRMSAAVRELHMLANGMDMLRQGDLDILGDLLASRFMSIHQSIIDGGWATARHLELLPLEDNSAAGNAVVLEARKHAKMAARLANQDLWTGGGGGKAKGGRGRTQSWGDSYWQTSDSSKGKGKKGGKGKGKNKNTWGGNQGGDGALREDQGEDPRKVTGPAEALGDALALAGRENQLSLEPTGSLPVTSFTDSLRFCTSFKRTGCVLLWWVVAGCTGPELDSITKELCDCWMNPPVSQAHVGRAKPRGSTFPLREGDLHEVVGVLRRVALQSAVGDDHVARWWADAWVCLALRSLP
jgi:hypothetical protein